MKNYFYLCLMAIAVSFSMVLTSCSDDDDDNGGGSSTSIKVGDQTANFGYVYWNIDDENGSGSKKYYQLEFYDFNFYGNKLNSKMSTFLIGFLAEGSDNALPTGTFSSFDLSGALNFSKNDPEGTYIEGNRNKSGKLVISKDGNSYTVTIEPLYIISGEEGNTTTTLTSLKYTGSIPKAPRKAWN